MLEDLFYVLDMDGLEDAIRRVDSGQIDCPAELTDDEWVDLRTAAEGAGEFISLLDNFRDKYDIDYF